MSNRIINTWRDPYDAGFSTCRRKQIEIKPGLTVLVGCNGSGKSTLLHNIRDELKRENIPYFYYDNEKDGGSHSIGESVFHQNYSLAATQLCSSEGENITLNLGKIASQWRYFIETGETNQNTFSKIFGSSLETTKSSKERWILLDAMDSGYSIDNVIEMKELFDLIIEDSKYFNIIPYIIISSNEYELVNGSNCLDVTEGTYLTFQDYDAYKKFILHTRKKKDKRYN